MEDHGEGDGVDEDHGVPEWQGEEGFRRGEGVHGVEHFDDDENGEGDGRGGLGRVIGEHRAADLWEGGAAAVEVGL